MYCLHNINVFLLAVCLYYYAVLN